MTEYIDISIPVTSDMLVYPGDASPALPAAKIGVDDDQWNTGRYEGGLHVGTHITLMPLGTESGPARNCMSLTYPISWDFAW
jgi:hypothetical protein